MKMAVRDAGKVKIVELGGRIVLGDGDEEVGKAVREILSQGHKQVVLNLSAVSYMDSCALGEVLACKKRAIENKAEIKLVIPPSSKIPIAVQTCLHLVYESAVDEVGAVGAFVS